MVTESPTSPGKLLLSLMERVLALIVYFFLLFGFGCLYSVVLSNSFVSVLNDPFTTN